jgi:hypothetical protein
VAAAVEIVKKVDTAATAVVKNLTFYSQVNRRKSLYLELFSAAGNLLAALE